MSEARRGGIGIIGLCFFFYLFFCLLFSIARQCWQYRLVFVLLSGDLGVPWIDVQYSTVFCLLLFRLVRVVGVMKHLYLFLCPLSSPALECSVFIFPEHAAKWGVSSGGLSEVSPLSRTRPALMRRLGQLL